MSRDQKQLGIHILTTPENNVLAFLSKLPSLFLIFNLWRKEKGFVCVLQLIDLWHWEVKKKRKIFLPGQGTRRRYVHSILMCSFSIHLSEISWVPGNSCNKLEVKPTAAPSQIRSVARNGVKFLGSRKLPRHRYIFKCRKERTVYSSTGNMRWSVSFERQSLRCA